MIWFRCHVKRQTLPHGTTYRKPSSYSSASRVNEVA